MKRRRPARTDRTPFECRLARTVRYLVALGLAVLLPASAWSSLADRAAYHDALRLLNAGRESEYRAARVRLDAYVLAPYLDFHDLWRRVDRIGEEELKAFRSAHDDLPVTRLLYHRWLTRLAERGDWARLARNPPEQPGPELQCLYLRARVESGTTAAFADVAPLWTVGHSQPRACDPLFDRWIGAGQLSQSLAWQRLLLAVESDQAGLARYLLRYLDAEYLRWGHALYDVHVTPHSVLESERFAPDRPETRSILTHGLRRLAGNSPEQAARAWAAYRASHSFSPEQASSVAGAIVLAYGRKGRLHEPWPGDPDLAIPAAVAQTLAQTAVNRQQWEAAREWIGRLPPEVQAETRWRYWTARALEGRPESAAERQALYRSLAMERDYYGFLGAQRAAVAPRLNAAPNRFDPAVDRAVRDLPAVRRALELYAVGDLLNARREWHALLPGLQPLQQVHAAYIAQQSGWIPQSILIANAASLRDHVDLRFPVAYPELFAKVSSRTAVAKPFLFAIARQESLFDPAARSTADARGLMQLLPSTAVSVARRDALAVPGIRELHEPAVNVDLGGRYLAQLLSRYGDRRPLAAAAYNAGPGRVDRWIEDQAGEPIDIWIENIPFGETRNYVKNVMAFTQVYGQLLDMPLPMVAPHEAAIP